MLIAQASEETEGTAEPECPGRLEPPEQYCLPCRAHTWNKASMRTGLAMTSLFLGRQGVGLGVDSRFEVNRAAKAPCGLATLHREESAHTSARALSKELVSDRDDAKGAQPALPALNQCLVFTRKPEPNPPALSGWHLLWAELGPQTQVMKS